MAGQELVVMVGLQGAGTARSQGPGASSRAVGGEGVLSHWPRARRRETRQQRVVAGLLADGRSVVVDNTHPSPAERAPLVAVTRAAGVPVRAVWLDTPEDVARARNATREGPARVPEVGLAATRSRFTPPSPDEGFDRVDVVSDPVARGVPALLPRPVL